VLAVDREPLAARHEHSDARTPAQDLVDEPRRGIQHMFATVEDEQPLLGREHLGDSPAQRHPRALLDGERFGHDDVDVRGIGGCELTEPHRRPARLDSTRRFAGDSRLADAARSDERDEPHGVEAFDDRRNEVVSTHEDVRSEWHARGAAALGRAGTARRSRHDRVVQCMQLG
jgi:hypothetical protein